MAKLEERPPDGWGDDVAKWSFILTLALAVAYVAAVFIYVM